ncbi:type II secretion system protein [Salinicola aestuarinus]|uniref:type II secretion system protein n=1 Tax=Salinicola aestuarinus TaxID=1949082 RepID=UPI001FD9D856|nr:type II secretion system protein [Salinicola aestuarinus]
MNLGRASHATERGFTLLEVMVALFLLAIIAVGVSQGINQRTRIAVAERDRLPMVLCARSLAAEFRLTHYWPPVGSSEGETTQAGTRCYWQLDVQSTAIRAMRRGDLTLFHDDARERAEITFTLFFSPR